MINRPSLKRIRVHRKTSHQPSLKLWLKQAEQIRADIHQDLKARALPDIVNEIYHAREERDNDVMGGS